MKQVFDNKKRSCTCRIGGAMIMVFLMSMFWIPDGAEAASSKPPIQKSFVSPEEGVP